MRTVIGLITMSILLLLAACGGAPAAQVEQAAAIEVTATAAPTVEPTTAPTEAPTAAPTNEPTAEPTAEPPTATPEPTVEPTKAPLPVISPETVIGLFTQFDQRAGGNNWMQFNADGTFAGRHGPTFDTGVPVTEGTYTLEGDVLTLIDPDECPTGESYRLEYRTQTQVRFELAGETTCDYLAADMEVQPNWKRAEP